MALIKEIELENGVIVKYHRIVSVNNITNLQSIIEVASYTSKEKREEEIEKIKKGELMDIFINTKYLNVEYNQSLDVEKAYEYLKTLDEFKNAEDDLKKEL